MLDIVRLPNTLRSTTKASHTRVFTAASPRPAPILATLSAASTFSPFFFFFFGGKWGRGEKKNYVFACWSAGSHDIAGWQSLYDHTQGICCPCRREAALLRLCALASHLCVHPKHTCANLSFFFDSVLIPDSLQRVFLAKNWFVGVKRCGEGVQRGVGGVLDHPRQQTEREAVN